MFFEAFLQLNCILNPVPFEITKNITCGRLSFKSSPYDFAFITNDTTCRLCRRPDRFPVSPEEHQYYGSHWRRTGIYREVIMGAMASQITGIPIFCTIVGAGADQRKHQNSASLAFVWGIHRWPENSSTQRFSYAENVSIWWRHHVLYIHWGTFMWK